jgi:hypothetical protein
MVLFRLLFNIIVIYSLILLLNKIKRVKELVKLAANSSLAKSGKCNYYFIRYY